MAIPFRTEGSCRVSVRGFLSSHHMASMFGISCIYVSTLILPQKTDQTRTMYILYIYILINIFIYVYVLYVYCN